jgi:hypothetical protein
MHHGGGVLHCTTGAGPVPAPCPPPAGAAGLQIDDSSRSAPQDRRADCSVQCSSKVLVCCQVLGLPTGRSVPKRRDSWKSVCVGCSLPLNTARAFTDHFAGHSLANQPQCLAFLACSSLPSFSQLLFCLARLHFQLLDQAQAGSQAPDQRLDGAQAGCPNRVEGLNQQVTMAGWCPSLNQQESQLS